MIGRDFYYFTRSERRGVIILASLVIVVYVALELLQPFVAPAPPVSAGQKEYEKEYRAFASSQQNMKSEYNRPAAPKREAMLAPFDPNTADSATFLRLGLPPWMAKNILRYRNKQGKFRRPEDFKKIHGLTDEQYQTLLPYIHITATPAAPKDSVWLLTATPRDTLYKYRPGTTVALNQADTAELKKIPGIGSAIARMIVRRRNLLGGFSSIEQLGEIRLKVEPLRPWLTVDTAQIQRINLNTATMERMMHHPYINFYQAKAIAEHREKVGKLTDLQQLALYEEFVPEDVERITPYVCFD